MLAREMSVVVEGLGFKESVLDSCRIELKILTLEFAIALMLHLQQSLQMAVIVIVHLT